MLSGNQWWHGHKRIKGRVSAAHHGVYPFVLVSYAKARKTNKPSVQWQAEIKHGTCPLGRNGITGCAERMQEPHGRRNCLDILKILYISTKLAFVEDHLGADEAGYRIDPQECAEDPTPLNKVPVRRQPRQQLLRSRSETTRKDGVVLGDGNHSPLIDCHLPQREIRH